METKLTTFFIFVIFVHLIQSQMHRPTEAECLKQQICEVRELLNELYQPRTTFEGTCVNGKYKLKPFICPIIEHDTERAEHVLKKIKKKLKALLKKLQKDEDDPEMAESQTEES